MEVFTQFASDLDDTTKAQIKYGQGLMQVLRQDRYRPYSQAEKVIILVTALGKLFVDIPVDSIKSKIYDMLAYFNEKHFEIIERIDDTGKLSDEDREKILQTAKEYLSE